MRIVVLGDTAASYAALIGGDASVDVAVIADPSNDWAKALALVAESDRAILTELPGTMSSEWSDLIAAAGDRLVLSRPLRFDRLFATARQALRAGDAGTLRSARPT